MKVKYWLFIFVIVMLVLHIEAYREFDYLRSLTQLDAPSPSHGIVNFICGFVDTVLLCTVLSDGKDIKNPR